MIGPFVNTKQTVEQIYSVRIRHETEGTVGLLNIKRASTLEDVRSQLETENMLQGRNFEFLGIDGIALTEKDESKERALSYIPVINVRTVSGKEVEKASIIVCRSATGEEFLTTRVPVHYTFANLLEDAANFWNVPIKTATLKDAEGFSWAENISVLKLLRSSNRPSTIFLHEEKRATNGNGNSQWKWVKKRSTPGSRKSVSWADQQDSHRKSPGRSTQKKKSQKQQNPLLISSTVKRSGYSQHAIESDEVTRFPKENAIVDIEPAFGTPTYNLDNKLFSIFTYYCVRGNTLHPDRMMFRQFKNFAVTCGMLSANFSQAS